MVKARGIKRTAKRLSKKKATSKKGQCFAIMPFGGWFDEYYTKVFVPAIKEAGLDPCRADDLYRPSTIVADIWTYTNKAKLIIADLSGKNPNVFYELGLAHALAKPAILVVESIDDVPFDLRALRVLEYDKNDPNWGTILHNKIVRAIEEVLVDPALSVPTAFLETIPMKGTPAITEHEKEMLAIRRDIDLMKREVRQTREIRHDPIPTKRASYYLTSKEALADLDRMYIMGFTRSQIGDRLRERGAPASWTDSQIDKFYSSLASLDKTESKPIVSSEILKGKSEPAKKISTVKKKSIISKAKATKRTTSKSKVSKPKGARTKTKKKK